MKQENTQTLKTCLFNNNGFRMLASFQPSAQLWHLNLRATCCCRRKSFEKGGSLQLAYLWVGIIQVLEGAGCSDSSFPLFPLTTPW